MIHNVVVALIAIVGIAVAIWFWYEALREKAIRPLVLEEWLFLTGLSVFGVGALLNAVLHFGWIVLP